MTKRMIILDDPRTDLFKPVTEEERKEAYDFIAQIINDRLKSLTYTPERIRYWNKVSDQESKKGEDYDIRVLSISQEKSK